MGMAGINRMLFVLASAPRQIGFPDWTFCKDNSLGSLSLYRLSTNRSAPWATMKWPRCWSDLIRCARTDSSGGRHCRQSLDCVRLSLQQEAPDIDDILIQFNLLGRPQGVLTSWNASITSPIKHARYSTDSLVPFRPGIANRTSPR